MTPLTELQDFFAVAADKVGEMFRETGHLVPMWHAVTRDDEHMLIATPWENDEEKNITSRELRKLFKAKGVKRFAFLSEAWVLHIDPKVNPQDIRKRPSEHADRREVLMIEAENREGDSLSGFFYILRPEHSDKPTLSPLHMNDYDVMAGRFTGMLR